MFNNRGWISESVYKVISTLVVAAWGICPAFSDVHDWDGGGADDVLTTALNWDNDLPLIATDDYHIDGFVEPAVGAGISASVYRLKIGVNTFSESALTMDGGQITADSHVFLGESAGSRGSLVINDGTFTTRKTLHVGFYGYGRLTVNGGSCNWRSGYDYYYLAINEQGENGDGGLVELFGGGVSGASLSIGVNGLLHIKAGRMILDGDCTTQIESLVQAGRIVAYNGQSEVLYDYDQTTPDKTTVYAEPPQDDPLPSWQYESGQDVTPGQDSFQMVGNGSVSKLFTLDFDSTPLVKLNVDITGTANIAVYLSDGMGGPQTQVRGPLIIDDTIYLDPLAALGWSGVKTVRVIFSSTGTGTVAVQEAGIDHLAHDILYPADNTDMDSHIGPDTMGFRWTACPLASDYVIEYWRPSDSETAYTLETSGQCFASPSTVPAEGLWNWTVRAYNGQTLINTGHTWSFRQGPLPPALADFDVVSLSVNNLQDFERHEVLSSGVPFAQGQFFPAQPVRLVDDTQTEIEFQMRHLAFWPDGSVKWTLLSFPTDIASRATKQYELMPAAGAPSPAASLAQVQNETITVDTSVLQSRIPLHGFDPLGDCTLNGSRQLSYPFSFRIAAILGAQPTDPATLYTAVGALSSSCLEENGPLRAVICTQGPMHDAQGNEGFSYILRQIYTKDESNVRFELTFICKTGSVIRGGVIPTVLLKNVVVDFGNVGTANYSFDPFNALSPLGTDTFILDQYDDDGYKVIRQDQYGTQTVIGSGLASQGICLTDTLGVGVKRFWQQFPKRILVNQNTLSVELWSDECSQPRRFATGSAKTHDISISLNDNITQAGRILAAKETPLFVACEPDYSIGTGAVPEMPPIDSDARPVDDALRQNLDDVIAYRDREDSFGMVHYGDVGEAGSMWWNSEVDMHKGALVQFLRSGNLDYLSFGIDMSRHNMDVDVCHYHPTNYLFVGGHCGHSDDHTTNDRFPYPSHTWLRGYLLDYYLTGYRRALDVAHETARGLVHAVTNDGVIHPYANKSSSPTGREFGHTLRNLSELYRSTGNAYYLALMKKLKTRIVMGCQPDGSLPEYCSSSGVWPASSFPDNKGGHYSSLALFGIQKFSQYTGDTSADDFIEGYCNWDIGCGSVPYKLGFFYHGAPGQTIWHDVDASSAMLPVLAYIADKTGNRRYLDAGRTLFDNIMEFEWNWQSYKKIVDARALYHFLDIENNTSLPPAERAPEYDSVRTIQYLRNLQNDDGGFGYWRGNLSDAESTCRALEALELLGDDAFNAGPAKNYVNSCRRPAEGYSSQAGWITDAANTYFSLMSLEILDESPESQAELVQWIKECQNYRSGELGGFGSSPRPAEYYGLSYIGYAHNWESSLQYTYFALHALHLLGQGPINASLAQDFVNSYIHSDGGAHCGIWSRSATSPRDVLSTYWLLKCFDRLSMTPSASWKDKTVQYLRGLQQADGGFSWKNGKTSTVRHTWLSVEALEMLDAVPYNQTGLISWLNQCANADGGFGNRPGAASDVLSTCYAVSILGYKRSAAFWQDLVDMAEKWLSMGQSTQIYPEMHYPFNEISGSVADDSAGDADGILHNFPLDDSQWLAGAFGNALSFDGQNDWLDIPNAQVADFYDKTISFWLRISSPSLPGFIIGSGAEYPVWILLNANGSISAAVQSESVVSQILSLGIFHHIALSIRKDTAATCTASLYVDGIFQGSRSDKPLHCGNLSGFNIGSFNDGMSDFAGFVMDDFRIYDQALDEDQIAALSQGQEIYQELLNLMSDWNNDGRIDILDFAVITQMWEPE